MSAVPRNIREDINRYVPGINGQNSDHGFERILLLLFGLAGHGKSSLINSCVCVVKNEEYRNLAGAGKDIGGRTKKRKSYNLTNTIRISDNRGFSKMKPEEILEACGQLRHLRQHEGDFEWEKDNLEETVKCIPERYGQQKEFILPIIVHNCLPKITEEDSMTELVGKCHEITGIPPIVVITNVGPPDARSGIGAELEKRFGDLGCTQRICLENYTENKQTRSPEADDQFLHFLDVCMNEAEYAIGQRERLDALQIFANHVANQVKEEKKMERKELEEKHNEEVRKLIEKHNEEVRKLKEEQNTMKRDLEESLRREQAKTWYQKLFSK